MTVIEALVCEPWLGHNAVALSAGSDQGVRLGMSVRVAKGPLVTVVDPDSKEVLGEVYTETIAYGLVVKVEPRFCIAKLDKVYGGINPGDKAAIVGTMR